MPAPIQSVDNVRQEALPDAFFKHSKPAHNTILRNRTDHFEKALQELQTVDCLILLSATASVACYFGMLILPFAPSMGMLAVGSLVYCVTKSRPEAWQNYCNARALLVEAYCWAMNEKDVAPVVKIDQSEINRLISVLGSWVKRTTFISWQVDVSPPDSVVNVDDSPPDGVSITQSAQRTLRQLFFLHSSNSSANKVESFEQKLNKILLAHQKPNWQCQLYGEESDGDPLKALFAALRLKARNAVLNRVVNPTFS